MKAAPRATVTTAALALIETADTYTATMGSTHTGWAVRRPVSLRPRRRLPGRTLPGPVPPSQAPTTALDAAGQPIVHGNVACVPTVTSETASAAADYETSHILASLSSEYWMYSKSWEDFTRLKEYISA